MAQKQAFSASLRRYQPDQVQRVFLIFSGGQNQVWIKNPPKIDRRKRTPSRGKKHTACAAFML